MRPRRRSCRLESHAHLKRGGSGRPYYVRAALTRVRAPILVRNRDGDRFASVEQARDIAVMPHAGLGGLWNVAHRVEVSAPTTVWHSAARIDDGRSAPTSVGIPPEGIHLAMGRGSPRAAARSRAAGHSRRAEWTGGPGD